MKDKYLFGHLGDRELEHLQEVLSESIHKPRKVTRKLGTTVYPQYRVLLRELNRGEPQYIFNVYHGYCEESEEAMRILGKRGTTYPIRLLPVIPNAIHGLPFRNLLGVRR